MDVRYLSDIERGNKNITLKTLYKIANVLNVKPMDLFVFPQNKNRKCKKLLRMSIRNTQTDCYFIVGSEANKGRLGFLDLFAPPAFII